MDIQENGVEHEAESLPQVNSASPIRVLITQICLIIFIWGLTHSFTLMWGMPNKVSFAADTVPITSTNNTSQMMRSNTFKYPPLQYLIWNMLVPVSKGKNYQEDFHLTARRIVLFRLVVAIMTLGSALLLWWLCRKTLTLGWWSLLPPFLFLLNPLSLYYSHTTNMDQPYTFWFMLSWVVFFQWVVPAEGWQKWKCWLANLSFGAIMACAFCTKDQVYALYFLPLIVYCSYRLYRKTAVLTVIIDGILWIAGFSAVTAIIYGLSGGMDTWLNHFAWITGSGVTPYVQEASTITGRLLLGTRSFADLAIALDWPLIILAVCGLVICYWQREFKGRVLAWMMVLCFCSFLAFFVQVTRFSYPRFYLPLILIAAVLAAKGLQQSTVLRFSKGIIIVVVILISMLALQFLNRLYNDPRIELRKELQMLEKQAQRKIRVGLPGMKKGVKYLQVNGKILEKSTFRDWSLNKYGRVADRQFPMVIEDEKLFALCLALNQPELLIGSDEIDMPSYVVDKYGFTQAEGVLPVANLLPSLYSIKMPELKIYTRLKEPENVSKAEVECSLEEQLQLLDLCFEPGESKRQLKTFGQLARDFHEPDTSVCLLQGRCFLLAFAAYTLADRKDSADAVMEYMKAQKFPPELIEKTVLFIQTIRDK